MGRWGRFRVRFRVQVSLSLSLSLSRSYITYIHTLPGILVVGLYTQPELWEVNKGLSCQVLA